MTGFVLRAPWYVRERGPFGPRDAKHPVLPFGLLDSRALRPEIQMYDDTRFVKRLLADPRDSLTATADDYWSYPVPVTLASLKSTAKGTARLATSRMCTTNLRKLFQPSHNRFYLVVVEVFCDQPGLPRAGCHDDISVSFVMRRLVTTLHGGRGEIRHLARNLLVETMKTQHPGLERDKLPASDIGDFWTAVKAREEFEKNNSELFEKVKGVSSREAWFRSRSGRTGWKRIEDLAADEEEVTIPMWRLPPRDGECDAARTRSTWFGVVPTFSAEHWVDGAGRAQPRLDDHSIYDLTCFVTEKPARGHEHCPPKTYWGERTEPFRLASPMDPDGTSKRITTITLPDLRSLAARAARPPGPGGVRIVTPPQSQLKFNPFNDIPKPGAGAIGVGGSVCTFALELFFIVAFFLFMLFLPIVILIFQLWWMLALRFCFPPAVAFDGLVKFFASGTLTAAIGTTDATNLDLALGLDVSGLAVGDQTPGWADTLVAAKDAGGAPIFATDKDVMLDVIHNADPDADEKKVKAPAVEPAPDDPLCR